MTVCRFFSLGKCAINVGKEASERTWKTVERSSVLRSDIRTDESLNQIYRVQ